MESERKCPYLFQLIKNFDNRVTNGNMVLCNYVINKENAIGKQNKKKKSLAVVAINY